MFDGHLNFTSAESKAQNKPQPVLQKLTGPAVLRKMDP